MITIPDCSILNVTSLGVTCFDISDVYCYPRDLYIELHRGTCRWLAFMIISRMGKRNSFLILRITIFELAKNCDRSAHRMVILFSLKVYESYI